VRVVAVLQKEHTVAPLEIVKDDDDFSRFSILIFTEDIEFFEQLTRTVGTLAYNRLVALVRLETHEDGGLFSFFIRDGFKIGVHLQGWIFFDLHYIWVFGGLEWTTVHFV